MREVWAEGEVYRRFMGRWSGTAAAGFVTWLDVADARTFLDAGCGAGALSAALASSAPSARVISMDRSPGFVAATRSLARGSASGFAVADALRLPLADGAVDGGWEGSGLGDVDVAPVAVPMTFEHFDDYWTPSLGGQGPAPTYLMSLAEPERGRLREEVHRRLPRDPGGGIDLAARAWAVRGTV